MNTTKTLPQDFIDDMQRTMGQAQADLLVQALVGTQPETSIRINPRKWNATLPLQRVPWCPTGYYLEQRPAFTFDPLLHAGAYYVQEASSMFIAEVLRQHLPGDARPAMALDLCAAPGGKSTLLRSILPDETLLVCNEPMPKRAQVLAENMTKWGHPNVVVTQSMPHAFTSLADAFDLVLTDVPCSGEGMFRKDPQAVADWSTDNVQLCCQRQREILEAVWPALRPGGLLVYSTCTFNRHEDEDNVRWIARELGADILPIACQPEWGVAAGQDGIGCHFYPHLTRGEGFYCAALRKNGGSGEPEAEMAAENGAVAGSKPETGGAAAAKVAARLNLYAHVILDLRQSDTDALPLCNVDYDTAVRYLRGEAIRLEPDAPRGLVTIAYRDLPLGQAKNIGSRANNLYPPHWRIKSTYIKPFTLGE